MYLGQSSAEKLDTKPWYYTTDATRVNESQLRKDTRRKEEADPLVSMRKYVKEKKSLGVQKVPNQSRWPTHHAVELVH
jgi:hypothetical protein